MRGWEVWHLAMRQQRSVTLGVGEEVTCAVCVVLARDQPCNVVPGGYGAVLCQSRHRVGEVCTGEGIRGVVVVHMEGIVGGGGMDQLEGW